MPKRTSDSNIVKFAGLYDHSVMMGHWMRAVPNESGDVDMVRLSGTEIEVARRVSRGYDRSDISTALGMSEKTYDSHMQRIKKKMGVSNAVQLANLAWTHGWLSPDWKGEGDAGGSRNDD